MRLIPPPPQPVHATRDIDVTEQDLAIYAALTGRKPVIEIVPPEAQDEPLVFHGYILPEAAGGLRRWLDRVAGRLHLDRVASRLHLDRAAGGLHLDRFRQRPRVSIWLHGMSISAKKHIEQARMRLAS
jgi:hypothetical protein